MNLPLTLRCSELDRVFSCNGSMLASSLVPRRDSEAGDEGSLLHYLIAKKAVEELGATPPDEGLVYPTVAKGYKLPAFSAWIVDWCFRWIRDNIPPDWTLMVEVPLAYEYALPRPVWIDAADVAVVPPDAVTRFTADGRIEILVSTAILSGHIDLLAISPCGTKAKGCDWKTGQIGADAAETNWQATGYSGLAKTAWPTLDDIEFTLAQPRLDDEGEIPRLTTAVLTGPEVERANVVIADRINAALENRYETNSGIKQCKYCSVGWRCPSIQGDIEFMKAQLTPEVLQSLKDAPDDSLLADFVVGARTLKAPIEAAEDLLHERLDATEYIDGSEVRITRKTQGGHYEIPDRLAFWNALDTLLPDAEHKARCMKPSMTEIKDVIADVMQVPKTSKSGNSASAIFEGHLRPHVEQKTKRILVFT